METIEKCLTISAALAAIVSATIMCKQILDSPVDRQSLQNLQAQMITLCQKK